jgi:hypothetical protein
MPDPPDKCDNVYRDQLSALSLGLALWNTNPQRNLYSHVTIGDVGYLQDGTFIRMFNVMLPWDDLLNRTLGQPETYEILQCGPFANTDGTDFDKVVHYSRSVSQETNASNSQAVRSDE